MPEPQPERRGEQRFPLRLPIQIRTFEGGLQEESSLTQDISARGAFFYVGFKLSEGTPVELTLTLPSEITLTESIKVRCKGKVVRVLESAPGAKFGTAAMIDQYDFAHDA